MTQRIKNQNRRWLLFGLFSAAMTMGYNQSHARGLRLRLGRIFGQGIPRGLGSKNYSANVLTPEQLRSCLLVELEISTAVPNLDTMEATIAKQKRQLVESSIGLETIRKELDQYDEMAVDLFNMDVARYERNRTRLNQKIEEFNRAISNNNSRIENFNLNCAGKKYYEEDMNFAKATMPK